VWWIDVGNHLSAKRGGFGAQRGTLSFCTLSNPLELSSPVQSNFLISLFSSVQTERFFRMEWQSSSENDWNRLRG